jgi:hypothetical protein
LDELHHGRQAHVLYRAIHKTVPDCPTRCFSHSFPFRSQSSVEHGPSFGPGCQMIDSELTYRPAQLSFGHGTEPLQVSDWLHCSCIAEHIRFEEAVRFALIHVVHRLHQATPQHLLHDIDVGIMIYHKIMRALCEKDILMMGFPPRSRSESNFAECVSCYLRSEKDNGVPAWTLTSDRHVTGTCFLSS